MGDLQRILVVAWFNNEQAPNKDIFERYRLPHQRVTRWPLQSFFTVWDESGMHVEKPGADMALDDFDAVHLAGWRRDYDMAFILGTYFEQVGVPFVGRTVLDLYPRSKIGEIVRLTAGGVRQPRSFYTSRVEDLPALYDWAAARSGLVMPIVIKSVDGSYGDDNFLVSSREELAAHTFNPELRYVMQEYVPNTFDYRVLVLGGQAVAVIKRERAAGGSHLNNVTRGAQPTFLPVGEVPTELCETALRAAQALARSDVAGVDIIVDETDGTYYVLEVNKTPNLSIGATGTQGIATKMTALYTYLDALASGKGGRHG